MLDLKRYYRLHPDGLCKVEKTADGNYVVLFKRFDNETGKELSPEPHYITVKQLKEDEATLVLQLSALHSILGDIEKL